MGGVLPSASRQHLRKSRKSRISSKRLLPKVRGCLRALCSTAEALFANDISRDRAYSRRHYQVRAAVRAVSIALSGHNAGIELPTGTGKTLIALRPFGNNYDQPAAFC